MARARVIAPADRSLDGLWELAAFAPGRATTPRNLDGLTAHWIRCDGPMPVAAALRDAGEWDPDHPRDLDAEDWWYRCRFRANPDAPSRLRFEGLATIADVWLNDRHILHSDSMFVAHVVDVQRELRADNELVFRFHALQPLLAPRRPRPRWRTRLVKQQELRWHRTSLLGRLNSWCPAVAPVGPWRPILIETGTVGIAGIDVRAEVHAGDAGLVRISLVTTASPPLETLEGHVVVGNTSARLEALRTSNGGCALTGIVRMPQVDRWWPHTHGSQPLYQVRASISAGDVTQTVDLGRVGFRTIEIDREADGHGFGLLVNGVPVFCRGACWTPLDLWTLSGSPAAYRSALQLLREAGINMIRIGGTTTYEADAFHDLCDELGILVWQDLMFANMDYPWQDETFTRVAETETIQLLGALQSRASLAVVCGSSEVDQQAAMLGLPAASRDNRPRDEHLMARVDAIAPGTAFLPSTPSGGTFPFHVNAGVGHYFGVGAYRRPFEDARRAGVRFAAECLAFSNVPDAATADLVLRDGEMPGGPRWKSAVPRDPGAGWDFEDVRDHYLQRLFGRIPAELRGRDPERYLALGRVASGEAMLRTFAEWRRPGSTCRGGLVWFARDFLPGAGWGIVDATGRPKAAYWYLKRALAPLALLVSDEGLNGLWIHAVNDTSEAFDGELRVARYRNGVMQGQPGYSAISIPARGHRSIHADALFDGFVDLTYAYQFGPPGHDVVAVTLRHQATGVVRAAMSYYPDSLPMPDAVAGTGLSARAEPSSGGYTLLLESERFAHAVAIDLDGWRPDDNYLGLEPGEPRRIELRPIGDRSTLRGTVSALNHHGPVAFVVAEAVSAK
jgi:beta-mannosidase